MGRLDFSLVHADDFALDDLGSVRPRQALDRLMQLLLAWRQDVDAEPIDMARLDSALDQRADNRLQRGA